MTSQSWIGGGLIEILHFGILEGAKEKAIDQDDI